MKYQAIAVTALKKVLPALALLVLLVLVVAWLAGAFTKKDPGSQTAVAGDHLAAETGPETYTVSQIEKEYVVEAIGTLKAATRTEISSRVMAPINRITVRAGDEITEGTVLVELDRQAFEAQGSQAEASLQAAVAIAAQAQDAYDRAVRLRERDAGTIPEGDFQQINANLQTAKASQSRAQQALTEAQVRLSYTTIKAPQAGMIVDRLAEEGDLAQPGVPLLVLYDPESLRLEVPVMEKLAVKIHKGDQLDVFIDALGRTIRAVVDEKVPQAEAATRSFLIKVKLPPSDDLYENMFGSLKIPAGKRPHLCIHAGAVKRIGQLDFVTVKDMVSGKFERRLVKLGQYGDQTHREVLSGLEAGDVVVLH